MRIALVHDYLNERGGAEVVLRKLTDMYPEAPIYTAFAVKGSSAEKVFRDRKVITSWMQFLPFYKKLYSPLRFLIPWIWRSFDFSEYDLVITSASWYITKGLFQKSNNPKHKNPVELCYCHTPPRWLYGYETSINWQKLWPVRIYALVVGHFLRQFDFRQAQKVTQFIANSENVARRIQKFYRRDSVVIYPPVSVLPLSSPPKLGGDKRGSVKNDYYLIVSRIVGGKGIELAIEAAKKYKFNLKIAGEIAGFNRMSNVQSSMFSNIEFLGRVSEEEKYRLMAEAKGFLALSRDEDFGITPVEAQMCGTSVIAFDGGGYRESVIDNKTGILFDDYSSDGLYSAILKFNKLKWNKEIIRKNALRFSDKIFEKKIKKLVEKYAGAA